MNFKKDITQLRRRKFIKSAAFSGLSSAIPLFARAASAQTSNETSVSEEEDRLRQVQPFSAERVAALNSLSRPLVGGSVELERDSEILSAFGRLSRQLTLARGVHSLPFKSDAVRQIRQQRLDTNAYNLWIDDAKFLYQVLAQGFESASERVKRKFAKGFGDLDIVGGSFVWIRQIQRIDQQTAHSKWELGENYWLDVYVRSHGFEHPFLRIFWDGIDFITLFSPFNTKAYLDEISAEDSFFMDSMTTVVDWRELALQFGLTDSTWYWRARFESAGYTNPIFHAPQPLLSCLPLQIFRPDGSYSSVGTLRNLLMEDPPTAIFHGCREDQFFDGEWDGMSMLRGNSPIPFEDLPAASELIDGRPGADSFVEYVLWATGNFVQYLGSGQFAVSFDEPDVPPSSTPESRNSEHAIEIKVAEELVKRGGAAIGIGLAAGEGAIALGDFVSSWRQNSIDRVMRRNAIQRAGTTCAQSSATMADCVICVAAQGTYAAEVSDIEDDFYISTGISVGGGAVAGCLAGAAFAIWWPPLALGWAVTCAIAAASAAATGAVASVNDYTHMKSMIATQHTNAFNPCLRLPDDDTL